MRQHRHAAFLKISGRVGVEVIVIRRAGIEFALDAIESSGDDRRSDEIRIRAEIGQAHFQAAIGNAHHRRAVVVAIRDISRRPRCTRQRAADDETFVGIDRWRANGGERGRMSEQAAHKMVGDFRQAQTILVGVVMKNILHFALADGHVIVAAGTGAVGEGLGHEGADHAVLFCDFRCRHFKQNQIVGRR